VSDNPEGRTAHWRKRAAQLRVIAEEFNHPQARDELLRLADQWEGMAEREERRQEIRRR
jgi:hypothetical protein